MPYKVRKRDCKQSDGSKGTHVVLKKKRGGGTEKRSCHKSEEKADAAVRARWANETVLRGWIRTSLTESLLTENRGEAYEKTIVAGMKNIPGVELGPPAGNNNAISDLGITFYGIDIAAEVKLNDKANLGTTFYKSDIKNNVFELRNGNTRIINNSGFGLRTGNFDSGNPPTSANVPNVISGGVAQNKFVNWLESKITNENAKILASPTLILGENSSSLSSGAALIDDSLSSATIGRPFKNEGFIKVGETVVTGFTSTAADGVVTCTATEGTAGITFGAKVDKIDDNGYVNFALSPAISSVTKSVEISGCGIQNTLSVRKLDTGSIRVKNGETLILTGVLQDSDTVTTSKVPILGDIPILGSLFRSNSSQKRKSELIILVTPKILKDK